MDLHLDCCYLVAVRNWSLQEDVQKTASPRHDRKIIGALPKDTGRRSVPEAILNLSVLCKCAGDSARNRRNQSQAMAMNLLLAAVAMAFGLIVIASPAKAAEIWAAGRLRGLAPERRVSFLRWYRAFGVVLFLGGVLFAVDSIGSSTYPQ